MRVSRKPVLAALLLLALPVSVIHLPPPVSAAPQGQCSAAGFKFVFRGDVTGTCADGSVKTVPVNGVVWAADVFTARVVAERDARAMAKQQGIKKITSVNIQVYFGSVAPSRSALD